MAQTGYTPILIYASGTATNVPLAANLTSSASGAELALNYYDGKLYYKDNAGVVQLLASKAGASGSVTSVDVSGGTTGLTTTGGPITSSGTITLTGTLITSNGGTGLTSYTAGDLPYYASGTALSKLGIGSSNAILTSSGSAPQWSTALTVTGLTDSGNLTFTGTGNRITGDFSNATVSNRVIVQTSTTNGNTIFGLIPNGTGTVCAFGMDTDPNLTNSSTGSLNLIASTDVRLTAGIRGAGTYLPLTFYTGGSERLRIDTSGNLWQFVNASTTSANYKFGDATTAYAQLSGYYDSSTTGHLEFYTLNTTLAERVRLSAPGNLLVGGTADRGTTVGTAHIDLFNGTAPAGTLTNGISLYSSSGDFMFMDAAGSGYKVGFRNVPPVGTKTTSYTLATTDVGKYVQVGSSGSIVIPDATFSEGDVISVFNNTSSSATITCTITTAYISGTDTDKATMTLATRGVATILFISGTVCVVSGSVS